MVSDHKPPRLAGGEAEVLHALLQYQRESLVRKVADLDDASARRSPVGSGTSLLWLIKHMARAEITLGRVPLCRGRLRHSRRRA